MLGHMKLNDEVLEDSLRDLKRMFKAKDYKFYERNCNNFCEVFAKRLIGAKTPSYVNRLARVSQMFLINAGSILFTPFI